MGGVVRCVKTREPVRAAAWPASQRGCWAGAGRKGGVLCDKHHYHHSRRRSYPSAMAQCCGQPQFRSIAST